MRNLMVPDGSVMDVDQVKSIGEALADSPRWRDWTAGLTGWDKIVMGMLLENQLNHYTQMDEATRTLSVGGFDKFAFPMIRAIYPNLAANELVAIQPMQGPTSMIFYMDYLYGTTKGSITAGTSAFDSRTGPTGNESYTSETISGEVATIASNDVSYTLVWTPVRPGTVTISGTSAGGAFSVLDDGNGGFVLISGTETISAGSINYQTGAVALNLANNISAATVTYRYDGEAADNTPQIDMQLTSANVTAVPRRIRARWSLEAAQNLQALHGISAEAAISGSMSEVIKHEIDREVINNLRSFASAGTVTWDKTVPSGISYQEHKLSIVDAFVSLNNKVYSSTKRINTNWAVCGVSVCDVIEALPTFQPIPGAFGALPQTGIVKIGTLNGRWSVWKDPFMPATEWLMGYKGNDFLDTGYVLAPYVPLYATPTVILDDFQGRRGVASQYGQKAVNSKFYAKGLLVNP